MCMFGNFFFFFCLVFVACLWIGNIYQDLELTVFILLYPEQTEMLYRDAYLPRTAACSRLVCLCVYIWNHRDYEGTVIAMSCAPGIPRTGRSDLCGPDRSSNIHFIHGLAEASKTANADGLGGDDVHCDDVRTCCVAYTIYYCIIHLHRVDVLSCSSPRDISQHARGAVHRSLPGDLCRSASVSSSAWPRHCYFTVRSLSPRLHHRHQTYTISCPCYYCHYRPIIVYIIGKGTASCNAFQWKNILSIYCTRLRVYIESMLHVYTLLTYYIYLYMA